MNRSLRRNCTLIYPWGKAICIELNRMAGVGDGNRTHNVRSHSPVLCQLSYSHHSFAIIATVASICLSCPAESRSPNSCWPAWLVEF